jgi:hypothetical protein
MLPRVTGVFAIVVFGLILAGHVHSDRLDLEETRTLPAAWGGRVPLFADHRPAAVLVVTAECAKCRIGVAAYADLATLVRREGFSFRSVIASGPVAGRQFAALLPDAPRVALDTDSTVLRLLRVRAVPALVLVDAARRHTVSLPLTVPSVDTIQLGRQIRRFR